MVIEWHRNDQSFHKSVLKEIMAAVTAQQPFGSRNVSPSNLLCIGKDDVIVPPPPGVTIHIPSEYHELKPMSGHAGSLYEELSQCFVASGVAVSEDPALGVPTLLLLCPELNTRPDVASGLTLHLPPIKSAAPSATGPGTAGVARRRGSVARADRTRAVGVLGHGSAARKQSVIQSGRGPSLVTSARRGSLSSPTPGGEAFGGVDGMLFLPLFSTKQMLPWYRARCPVTLSSSGIFEYCFNKWPSSPALQRVAAGAIAVSLGALPPRPPLVAPTAPLPLPTTKPVGKWGLLREQRSAIAGTDAKSDFHSFITSATATANSASVWMAELVRETMDDSSKRAARVAAAENVRKAAGKLTKLASRASAPEGNVQLKQEASGASRTSRVSRVSRFTAAAASDERTVILRAIAHQAAKATAHLRHVTDAVKVDQPAALKVVRMFASKAAERAEAAWSEEQQVELSRELSISARSLLRLLELCDDVNFMRENESDDEGELLTTVAAKAPFSPPTSAIKPPSILPTVAATTAGETLLSACQPSHTQVSDPVPRVPAPSPAANAAADPSRVIQEDHSWIRNSAGSIPSGEEQVPDEAHKFDRSEPWSEPETSAAPSHLSPSLSNRLVAVSSRALLNLQESLSHFVTQYTDSSPTVIQEDDNSSTARSVQHV